MVIPFIVAAGAISLWLDIDKSAQNDKQALNEYAKAYEYNAEARLLLEKKNNFAQMRLSNVIKKKQAIRTHTFPKFQKIYGAIQKVIIEDNSSVAALTDSLRMNEIGLGHSAPESIKRSLTDKEIAISFLTEGIGGVLVKESELRLSAAKNHAHQAEVRYSQAESYASIYDAFVERADRIAKLLMNLNALFIKSISETERIIEKNGLDVHNYSNFDKGVLMTCVNIAIAISEIMSIPILKKNGELAESAVEMIETGETYLQKIRQTMEEY